MKEKKKYIYIYIIIINIYFIIPYILLLDFAGNKDINKYLIRKKCY